MNDKDDLLTLLDTYEDLFFNNEDSGLNSAQSQISLLDNKNDSAESNVVTPDSILNDYTKLEFEKRQIQMDIEEFKEENREIFEKLEEFNSKIENISIKQDNMKTQLTDSLGASGRKDCANKYFKVTYVASYKKETFDKDKFKTKYPVLFNQFVKKSDVSAYVKISEVKRK